MTDDGLLLTRIVIERRIVGDEDRILTTFEDRDGDDPPLIETLGLLEMAKDTVMRSAMGDLPNDLPDDED